MATLKVKVTSL